MKHIHHTTHKKLDDLQRSLTQTLTTFDGEDVHIFRVKIKKLRAFLTLLAAEDPQHAPHTGNGRVRLPHGLRRFYKITGEIRNRQLQLERIKEYWKDRVDALPGNYINRLTTELAASMTRAGSYAANNSPVKTARKGLNAAIPAHLHRKPVKKFLRKRTDTLESLLSTPQPWDDDHFHSIRKNLKDWQYMLPDLPPGLSPAIPFRKEKISSLTEALGEVQDSCTALALLNDQYLDPIPDGPEKNELEKWKKYCQEEKKRCKLDIYAQLQDMGLLNAGPDQPHTADPAIQKDRKVAVKAAK